MPVNLSSALEAEATYRPCKQPQITAAFPMSLHAAEYVEGGGSYLGLCAGAYYGCSSVEFEPGSSMEVSGDRELAFFPGAAIGAAYPGV